jgi:hypothetical protein
MPAAFCLLPSYAAKNSRPEKLDFESQRITNFPRSPLRLPESRSTPPNGEQKLDLSFVVWTLL